MTFTVWILLLLWAARHAEKESETWKKFEKFYKSLAFNASLSILRPVLVKIDLFVTDCIFRSKFQKDRAVAGARKVFPRESWRMIYGNWYLVVYEERLCIYWTLILSTVDNAELEVERWAAQCSRLLTSSEMIKVAKIFNGLGTITFTTRLIILFGTIRNAFNLLAFR